MSIIRKNETSAMLGNKAKSRNKNGRKKQQPKPCIASHVNQTTDRDDKVHGAIALQLVRAPSLN